MGNLAALFGNPELEEKGQDSEKLMDLYWNRAELKKAYAEARNEQFRLNDRIKQEEGATARLQQKLDHIEALLIEPDSAYDVLAYYLLRGLAGRCESKLAMFAEQLKQQREKKQHESLMSSWHARLEQDSAEFEEQLLSIRNQIRLAEEKLGSLAGQIESMGFFQKLFKGRRIGSESRSLQQAIVEAQAAEQAVNADLALVNEQTPPDSPGLSNVSKRSINLMIIAFAQQLYLQFLDPGFAALVKESMDKSAGGVHYGPRFECQSLLEQIQKKTEIMDQNTDHASVLQRRAKLIGDRANFESDDDVIPSASSTMAVFDFDDNGNTLETEVPILRDNYWGIARVLSR